MRPALRRLFTGLLLALALVARVADTSAALVPYPFSPSEVKPFAPDVIYVGDSLTLGIWASPVGQYGYASTVPPTGSYPTLQATAFASAGVSVNVWNAGVGSGTISNAPGPYCNTGPVLSTRVATDITGHLQGGKTRNVVVVWAGINDILHESLCETQANPSYLAASLCVGCGAATWTRLQSYVAQLVAAGAKTVFVSTLAPQNWLGAQGYTQAGIASLREVATFNTSVYAGYSAIPGVVGLLDMANLAAIQSPGGGTPFYSDQLHFIDYAAISAYIYPMVAGVL